MKTHPTRIEILEGRIAPAQTFFLSGAALVIHDSANALVPGDTDAATFTHADKALRLSDGDTIVYDLNGDGIKNAGDVTLLKLKSGKATAFFTDVNASGKFDLSEFTGLALGDAVQATVTAVINGDVATVLQADGSLPHGSGNFELQQTAIDGLKIVGRVTAGVYGGTGIKNFSVLAPAFSRASDLSAGSLVVGVNGGGQNLSFDGGTNSISLLGFTPAPGAAGGDIVKVHLANGATFIQAGNGADGTGGNGGNVIGLTIDSTPGTKNLTIAAGGGAAVVGTGAGGQGGRVEAVKVNFPSTGSLEIDGGKGGPSADGAGGAGGAVLKSTITALREPRQVQILGGNGDSGGKAGVGGDGGAVSGIKATLSPTKDEVSILGGMAGDGGANGGAGGNGGALSDTVLLSGGTFGNGPVSLRGGNGGGGHGTGGKGGTGGALTNLTAKITGAITGSLSIDGGTGGVANDSGAGGDGGAATKITALVSGASDSVEIYGGYGGAGKGGNGGRGGNLSGVTLTILGEHKSGFDLGSGGGGDVSSGTGNGGDSGDTSKITILNLGRVQFLGVYTESAGNAGTDGKGGKSGNLSDVTILSLGETASGNGNVFDVGSYNGGRGGSNSGDGGNSGNVTNVKITDLTGNRSVIQNNTFIYVSQAGDAPSATGKGGDGGTLSKVTLNGPNSHFIVNFSTSSRGGNGGAGGGTGGDITDLKVTAQILDIFGSRGGNATTSGSGGDGGNVSKIKVSKITDYVHGIRAGDGGNGIASGGQGGSITDVKVPGDIGDFRTSFGNSTDENVGMGGLIAGAGGTGITAGIAGSISKVTALRIAAILAGRPTGSTLTAANAVTSISAISALVIGADVNDDRLFTFTDNGGTAAFDLGTTDVALDGFVLVKTGGFTPPAGATVLKVIPV